MSTFLRTLISILLLSPVVHALDHESCVLDHVKVSLNSENSCVADNLKQSVENVQSAYADCDRDAVMNSSSLSMEDVKKISAADYDKKIQNLFTQKITSCGYKGYVQIKSKGLIRSINILKSVGSPKAVVARDHNAQ